MKLRLVALILAAFVLRSMLLVTMPSVAYQDSTPTPTADFDPDGYIAGPGQNFVALDNPAFVEAAEADWMQSEEIVLGLEFNGETRAYPVRMMTFHHIINDEVLGTPVLVTF